jgi:hypothetical protein
MIEARWRLELIAGVALVTCAIDLAGCGPTPVTRTVTSEVTTTTVPRQFPAPLLSNSSADDTLAPVHRDHVRYGTARNGDMVSEETTESASTSVIPPVSPVWSTSTRSTTETIAPR